MNFRRLKLFSWRNGKDMGDCFKHQNAQGESKRSGSVWRRLVARQVKKTERREVEREIENGVSDYWDDWFGKLWQE